MAKFKKTAKKTGARRSSASAGAERQGEGLSRSLSESAQQIWLAGVGAFGRAQAEGTRLFEALVREGQTVEEHARRFAGGQADVVRDAVESRVGQARHRATDTWDRLEKVFEERVQRALLGLGVPNREDLTELTRRVDALTAELRRQSSTPAARKVAAARPVAKKATRKAAKRPAATTRPRKPAAG
ncbi:phasin family protein [Luteimonas sp. RD2P54]|uniref:Phasin family protein n=1 Tax=Luteimonas endophytica TaxID=3042023 RepID=A0ABT6J4I1_9GAMM|nr:phasin family protein [Luteimonas endophytica]MDH5821510.1 phasin family protein [Luteimonas endophytica]